MFKGYGALFDLGNKKQELRYCNEAEIIIRRK